LLKNDELGFSVAPPECFNDFSVDMISIAVYSFNLRTQWIEKGWNGEEISSEG